MQALSSPNDVAAGRPAVTPMEEYLFDLRGFLVLRNAIAPDHLAEINAALDTMLSLDPPLQKGEWYGGGAGAQFRRQGRRQPPAYL